MLLDWLICKPKKLFIQLYQYQLFGKKIKFSIQEFYFSYHRYGQQSNSNELTSMKKSPTNEFEIITTSSLSSSISIVNCTEDDFTPLPSPLYTTAIAYSPTTDII